jgi:DNA polymerase (family 10)
MNNYAIARVFTRIADLMEIQGQNAFKIRAYRNAAATMQELTESLEVLAERNELENIPGIGEAIAQKTRDILATGTTKLYENLKAEVPETLIGLLDLPGFGPKKIQAAWKELGVRNLDDLERAAAEHRLRTLPGMGEKSEGKVLEALAAFRRRKERTPIGIALPYARGLARLFLETGAFERCEPSGSVRRRGDLVGDLDFVAAATDPEAAIEAFMKHAEIREVQGREDDHVKAVAHNGVPMELKVVRPEAFPGALHRATGSKAHMEALEQLAAEKGINLTDLQASAESEEAIYAALGLPCIPPELREGRGEIEAAREGRLPKLIEAGDIRGVLHAHSTWSDGSASIERMAAAARELGFAFHAVTDHSQALGIARGLNPERLRQQMAEIDALNATYTDGFRILKGIECDILPDGSMDLPLELLAELDVVVASVHSQQRQDRETITARVIKALESGVVDILAHPTGRILGMRDPQDLDLERVMDAAVANQVALEINAYPDRLDLDDVQAHQAKERGIPITINPDAHRPEHLSLYEYGICQARRAWLEAEDVINTWPLDRLLQWLHQRR